VPLLEIFAPLPCGIFLSLLTLCLGISFIEGYSFLEFGSFFTSISKNQGSPHLFLRLPPLRVLSDPTNKLSYLVESSNMSTYQDRWCPSALPQFFLCEKTKPSRICDFLPIFPARKPCLGDLVCLPPWFAHVAPVSSADIFRNIVAFTSRFIDGGSRLNLRFHTSFPAALCPFCFRPVNMLAWFSFFHLVLVSLLFLR